MTSPSAYLISLLLLVGTIAVFWSSLYCDFVVYDDGKYVFLNPIIKAGLSIEGAVWAFTTNHASNWHPLTWLSHMLDVEIFGMGPGGHHFVNIIFHSLNSLLLFLFLLFSTGATRRSAFLAALFAVHPIHVESVVWVSERKDVLSTFFWMLTMVLYLRYVRNNRIFTYLSLLIVYAVGLTAKPMLVTLPFVLLLLDYWPLQRIGTHTDFSEAGHPRRKTATLKDLLLEKTPLLALSFISSAITYSVQEKVMASSDALGPGLRAANAAISSVNYLGKMAWPINLAVFYPHPQEGISPWAAGWAALLLGVMTFLILNQAGRRPYLFVGWLWYCVTLVPVLGLIQVGSQAMADRYMYIPSIGLFFMIAWLLPEVMGHWRFGTAMLAAVGLIVLTILTGMTRQQIGYWENSGTLFRHAIAVTSDNWLAHGGLGVALNSEGKTDEAIFHLRKALSLRPHDPEQHYNLGLALVEKNDIGEAVSHYREAIRIKPDFVDAYNRLSRLLAREGEVFEARALLLKALEYQPGDRETQASLRLVDGIISYLEAGNIPK